MYVRSVAVYQTRESPITRPPSAVAAAEPLQDLSVAGEPGEEVEVKHAQPPLVLLLLLQAAHSLLASSHAVSQNNNSQPLTENPSGRGRKHGRASASTGERASTGAGSTAAGATVKANHGEPWPWQVDADVCGAGSTAETIKSQFVWLAKAVLQFGAGQMRARARAVPSVQRAGAKRRGARRTQ